MCLMLFQKLRYVANSSDNQGLDGLDEDNRHKNSSMDIIPGRILYFAIRPAVSYELKIKMLVMIIKAVAVVAKNE